MKKEYKLSIRYDDEVDSISEVVEDADDGSVWLDTGDETVQLPAEIVKYLESDGILGIA